MYSKRAGLILGFHGCDKSLRDKVVTQTISNLKHSVNDYDWLGNGVYFWENSYERALQYAKDLKKILTKVLQILQPPQYLVL